MRSVSEDLTAKAKIRDAAVVAVARHGVAGTTVRSVAAAAGVSAGLVLHHFGSKNGLIEACDEAVLAEFLQALAENAQNVTLEGLLDQKVRNTKRGAMVAYAVRALRDGQPFGQRVFREMVDQVERYLRASVEAGITRPAKDEHLRAEMLTTFSLGSAMLARYVVGLDVDPVDVGPLLTERYLVEGLDLYTDGMFTDSRIRDAMLDEATDRKGKQ